MIRGQVARTASAAILLVVLAEFWQTAFAFTPGACRQDAERICPGAQDKEIVPCLKEHQVDLSTACKVNLAEARERVRQTREACDDDTKKFCPDVAPGKGRIVQCLKAHETQLSTGCREKMAETKKKLFPDATKAQ